MEDYLVPLDTPCVFYYPNLISADDAERNYDDLQKNVPWEKTAKINRWVALYEETPENGYKYRDAPGQQSSRPFTDTIRSIKEQAEQCYENLSGAKVEFNTCLLNFYEDGEQRIGWHADREEIGRTTPIASISLGATRTFSIRHKANGARDRANVDLQAGSVIFMENVCQREYLHSIPKQREVGKGRINLTFRCKTGDTPGEEEHERRDRWYDQIVSMGNTLSHPKDLSVGIDHQASLFGDGIRTEFSTEEPSVCYTMSCNIGTECQVAAEAVEAVGALADPEQWEVVARPWGVPGYVAIANIAPSGIDDKRMSTELASTLLELRSILHVMEYHDHFALEDIGQPSSVIDGEALYQFYKKRLSSSPGLISTLASSSDTEPVTFRVTSDRIGSHKFRTPDVEYEMGGACSEIYQTCKPKMKDYDVNIRIDVVVNKVIIGTQINVRDLTRRHFLRYRNKVSLKTNLAYVMLRLAGIKEGDLLVDPFCGSGTILLEALEVTSKKARVAGFDVSRRAATGAAENAVAEGYGPDICSFHCCDARAIRKHVADEAADAVITNLPWGVQTGHNQSVTDLQQTYEAVLRSCWYCLKPGGRVVMLVLRGLQMVRILRKLGGRYRILKAIIVRTTNNLPCIIVAEKLGHDLMNEDIKGQLAYMSQFVNVSSEMYHAIKMENIDEAN